MIEFGETLRRAREAKGYSVSQLAERTHILPQIIESLEKEDLTPIVAPIYGRGFVKLYCESVGIDAKPLIAEFMDIYSGNRPPTIRLKGVTGDGEAVRVAEAPAGETTVAEEPAVEPEAEAVPEPDAEEPAYPAASPFDITRVAEAAAASEGAAEGAAARRSWRDYRPAHYALPEVPRRFWRFGLLTAAAAVTLALVGFGIRAVYRATMTAPEGEESADVAAEAAAPAEAAADATPAKPRTPTKIPPLYID